MGFVRKQPNGRWRACWREATGNQKSKTFETKKAASAHLAEVETSINRGSYVDPHAGKRKFGPYAEAWLKGRNDERATAARDASVMRVHVLRRWGAVPIGKVEHSAVQRWVTELGQRRSRATVAEALRLTSTVLRSAVRDRIIAFNPCEGVRLPKRRREDSADRVIRPEALVNDLLPEVPVRYRALVALAGGTGLRWGECVGLRWRAVDLEGGEVQVVRVITEVAGQLFAKPYPKSKAGRRTVPMAPYAWQALAEHHGLYTPGRLGEVFTNRLGELPKRTSFRVRVWRPALVRAGLLGKVVELGGGEFLALWEDNGGLELTATLATEAAAVEHIARSSAGGLRFHDLRHSYATHLVSSGVPVNDVQNVMGHEQASTTLDRYTHRSPDRDERVRGAFDAFSLHEEGEDGPEDEEDPSGEGP
jgi:integrase